MFGRANPHRRARAYAGTSRGGMTSGVVVVADMNGEDRQSQCRMMQVIRTLRAESAPVVSLGGCVAGEAGRLLAPPQHRCWRVQPPSDLPHLQLPVRGELTVSRNNCFALTFRTRCCTRLLGRR